MPHSLRVRLKNLQRKGELTEKDIDRIFKALEQEPSENHEDKPHSLLDAYFQMRAEQEPISVSVSEKEPDEISEELSFKIFANTLKCRWRNLVIYNVEWLKKNWQMEMDIVCGVKPSEDAISRQAVLDIVCGAYEKDGWGESNFYKAINKLPSVQPKAKTVHWIERPTEEDYSVCSRCGIGSRRMEHGKNADGTKYIDIYSYRFCPYCGACMKEGRTLDEFIEDSKESVEQPLSEELVEHYRKLAEHYDKEAKHERPV